MPGEQCRAGWAPGLCRAERAGSRGARGAEPGRRLLLAALAIVLGRKDLSRPGIWQRRVVAGQRRRLQVTLEGAASGSKAPCRVSAPA